MSYQVLARKYRPATFQELSGQEHVLQALINALENNRLHHAYLFTGTRGVGKTSIARILAKCFNCEAGVTATPCGTCGSCEEIASGRSVDLLEIDAASHTGVDDMRDLLDNVQYMPTVSRFKIYLIDEVHMLSKSSFNAMLKTLEEPPEHIKFLFATTDPKKLPITVLSRCLQFNLKNLSPEQIVEYLQKVLEVESIPFEEPALWQLGQAADGSMRDALSLTDQAISFGDNQVKEEEVRTMLGTIGHAEVYSIIHTIAAEDGAGLLARVAQLAEYSPDYEALLNDILAALHRIAIAHAVPDSVDNSQGDQELILTASQLLAPEAIQLLYQIGLIGQRDLPLAPTQRIGLEMILLRMMSFVLAEAGTPKTIQKPGADRSAGTAAPASSKAAKPSTEVSSSEASSSEVSSSEGSVSETLSSEMPASEGLSSEVPLPVTPLPVTPLPETPLPVTPSPAEAAAEQQDKTPAPEPSPVTPAPEPSPVTPAPEPSPVTPAPEPSPVTPLPDTPSPGTPAPPTLPPLSAATWAEVIEPLGLTGVTHNIAINASLVPGQEESQYILVLDEGFSKLWNKHHAQRITKALSQAYGKAIGVSVEVGKRDIKTPAQQQALIHEQNIAQAMTDMGNDQTVQALLKAFDGTLDPSSIVPLPQDPATRSLGEELTTHLGKDQP